MEVRVTHDGRNRTSTLDNQLDGVNVAAYAYSYDPAGNVMQVTETYPGGSLDNRTITNAYDGIYRLLSEAIATTGGSTVTTTYLYDKGHNRTSKTVSSGTTTSYIIGNGSNGAGANQIVSEMTGDVSTAYTYDANGNRTTKTVGGNTDTYTYDDENRLINLDYLTGESGTGTYAYSYDYRTRRVTRTEPGPVITHISFDGGTSILEYGATGAASPNVEYVRGHDYGGGVGGLEYSIRSGTARFNSYDSRGDVTTQTDASGAVTFQTAYEAFGDQTATSGSTSDRQRASTKEQDPTGLLNEGFRYRDPATGAFLTRDPLGFKAGLNNYTYVHQNPWTHFDPEGLEGNQPNPPPRKKIEGRIGPVTMGLTGGRVGAVTIGSTSHIGSVTGSSNGALAGGTLGVRTGSVSMGPTGGQVGSVAAGATGGHIGSVTGGGGISSAGGQIGPVSGGPTAGRIGSVTMGPPTAGPIGSVNWNPFASARNTAIYRATSLLPIDQTRQPTDSKKGDSTGIYITHYGQGKAVGGWDPYHDPNTDAGKGNTGNKLNNNSLSISPDIVRDAGLKSGDPVYVNHHYIGNYDDTTGKNELGRIDIYDPSNSVRKTYWSGMIDGRNVSNHP